MKRMFVLGLLGALFSFSFDTETQACQYCGRRACGYSGGTYYSTGVSSYYPSLGYYTASYYAATPPLRQYSYPGYQSYGMSRTSYYSAGSYGYAPSGYGYPAYATFGSGNSYCRGGCGGTYGSYTNSGIYGGCNSCGVSCAPQVCNPCSSGGAASSATSGQGSATGTGVAPPPSPMPDGTVPSQPIEKSGASPTGRTPPEPPAPGKTGPDARRPNLIRIR